MPSSPPRLMAAGMPARLAAQIGSGDSSALTATGTTKATALLMPPGLNVFTTVGSNAGARLPDAAGAPWMSVYNGGANPLLVYTNNALDVINALSAGGSFSVTNGKSAVFVPAGNRWIANLGA